VRDILLSFFDDIKESIVAFAAGATHATPLVAFLLGSNERFAHHCAIREATEVHTATASQRVCAQ
jgi:hypothetical protein